MTLGLICVCACPAVHGAIGCGHKKLLISVAVPPAPVRVPSQRPLAQSVASVTNDKGDNEMILGAVHRSPTAGGNLRFRESVRYLGVILQGGLKIDDHLTETANNALARLGGQGWGYQAVN